MSRNVLSKIENAINGLIEDESIASFLRGVERGKFEQASTDNKRLDLELSKCKEVIRKARLAMSAVHGLELVELYDQHHTFWVDFSAELAACDAVCPKERGNPESPVIKKIAKVL